ncbi:hypothetical protein PHMEG_00025324 [Phytophthora megakarya]|uniref:Uncharacterized protein n=1 Tax=Phytophthora megakarya TaxID=4795 RepID=A0A225VDY1_9STRA|nr:hypothetical protein PHMEG_00025324 [Phytophthora megakarya]
MTAALGPNAINDKKFSTWSSTQEALRLTWDTEARVVSVPADKIDKALARISKVLYTKQICKHQLEKQLGSLCQIGLCCRPSRAFIQRLHYTWRKASKFVKINLTASVCEDLYWIQAILKRGGISDRVMLPTFTRIHSTSTLYLEKSIKFRENQSHSINLYWIQAILKHGGMSQVSTSIIPGTIDIDANLFMDASNSGLCVLYPATREYIRVRFDTEEIYVITITTDDTNSVLSVNVREALSAVFANIVWGPRWSRIARTRGVPVHARCWIDNTSAVSWIKRHFRSNSYGQELMRVLSCAETEFQLHISTAHLQGSTNVLADMVLEHEPAIPSNFRKFYNINSPNYNVDRSLTQLEKSTWEHGVNGVPSAPVPVCPPGSTSTISTVNRFSWLCSWLAAGKETTKMVPADLTPFGLKSAMCAGVISSVPGSGHVCS